MLSEGLFVLLWSLTWEVFMGKQWVESISQGSLISEDAPVMIVSLDEGHYLLRKGVIRMEPLMEAK